MKSIQTLLMALCLLCLPALSYANLPALNAVAVAQLAQKDLEDRGLQHEIFISEIEYKGLLGEPYWLVYWSKKFPANTPGLKEWGLKFQMDGSFVRMVRKR